jgi:hypothetical protein
VPDALPASKQAIHLLTAVLAIHAPLAEVLAVVGEQPIAVFTNSRTRSLHNL